MKKLLIYLLTVFTVMTLAACTTNGIDEDDDLDWSSRTPRTDRLELTEDYEGKSFIEDGIGEVELMRCIDGDTADFSEDGGVTTFRVRFLGIDTPETGRDEEPWAEAASQFVCIKLSNADHIVLQHDESTSRRGTYGRWLGFVWYDGRLINLELIEEGYTPSTGIMTQYGDEFQSAWYEAMAKQIRIHGQPDPNFNYND